MGKLVVTDFVKGRVYDCEVSQSCIDGAKLSKQILIKTLDMEVLFDQVVETYWDYKNKANYWHTRAFFREDDDYSFNHEIRSSLNRLAFNLLNLSKLYLDLHFSKSKGCFASDITSDQDSSRLVKEHREQVYSENLGYLVGCLLRNYCQHSKLPVRDFTVGMKTSYPEKKKLIHFSVSYDESFFIKIEVPKTKLAEASKLGLTEILDGFVYGFAQMHDLNRQLTRNKIEQARFFFRNLLREYFPTEDLNVATCEIAIGDLTILPDLKWFSVYDYLQAKHPYAVNYADIEFINRKA